jgi:hypothetical protein
VRRLQPHDVLGVRAPARTNTGGNGKKSDHKFFGAIVKFWSKQLDQFQKFF